MSDDKDMKAKEELNSETENNVQENNIEQENEVDNTPESQEAPSMEEKYGDLNDRFIRLHAEFDNFRKRTNKEKIEIISNANEGVLKDLLPVMDDFERAIANNENATDIESIKEGFNLIFNKFRSILESKGLKKMESKGEAFDSDLHEAIANIPAPDKDAVGKVIDDVEKGYYLNEKVIRFAKVVVGQ